MTNNGVLTQVLEVFDAVGTWIGGAMENLTPMFYTPEEGLEFLGVLAIAGLAFSVIFLLLSIITNFLHFRGM